MHCTQLTTSCRRFFCVLAVCGVCSSLFFFNIVAFIDQFLIRADFIQVTRFLFRYFVEQQQQLYIYYVKRNLHHKSTFIMSLVSSKNDILTFHSSPNSHRTQNVYSGKIQFWRTSPFPTCFRCHSLFRTCAREQRRDADVRYLNSCVSIVQSARNQSNIRYRLSEIHAQTEITLNKLAWAVM